METLINLIIAIAGLGTSGFFLKRFVTEIDENKKAVAQQHKDISTLIKAVQAEAKILSSNVDAVRVMQAEKESDLRTQLSRLLLMLDRADEKIRELHAKLDSSQKKAGVYDEILKTLIRDWTEQKKEIASLKLTLGKALLILKEKK